MHSSLPNFIQRRNCNCFLPGHDPSQFHPMMPDAFLSELMADGINHPIREQSQNQVNRKGFIFLMTEMGRSLRNIIRQRNIPLISQIRL